MIKKLLLSFLLLINCSLTALDVSPQETAYVERLSQTIDLLTEKQAEIWPGYDIAITPIVISFGNGHIYAFNLLSENPVWEKRQLGDKEVLFSTQDPWGVTSIAMQDQFPMEDKEVFAFNVGLMQSNPKQEEYLPLLVIVHELFHRYQFNAFNEDQGNRGYQDRDNGENLALINLEEQILIDFLSANESDKSEHLKNFTAIHKIRKALIKTSSLQWEDSQQRMEGLADYVSIRAQDVFAILPGFSGREHISAIIEGYVHNSDVSEFAIKWRHYGVGAALGYGLDHEQVLNWKEKIQDYGISLADQLEEHFQLSSLEVARRVWQVKQAYRFKVVKEDIAARIQLNKADLTALIEGFKEQKGVVVVVDRPKDSGINGGGNTGGIYHLPNGSTVSVNDSSFSASTDNLWKIEVRKLPYLFQKGNKRWWKVDEDLKIILDGQEYSMQELMLSGKTKSFHNITWKGESCDFESAERPGCIKIENGQLIILL